MTEFARIPYPLSDTASSANCGQVWLVGAGPGDPELLTRKAWRLLQQAELVVYDKLVSAAILAEIPSATERLFAGKARGQHSLPQEAINALLVREARRGRLVVRLKGGDPFIFGRGGEELLTLAAAGVPFGVVPGVTAATGCAAAAGMPLTHRGLAHSVQFLTACLQPGQPEPDWSHLKPGPQTLVFYMGLTLRARISQRLLALGFAADLPAALISAGSTAQQQVVLTTLAQLPQVGEHLPSPTLLIVGEVCRLHAMLAWWPGARQPGTPVATSVATLPVTACRAPV